MISSSFPPAIFAMLRPVRAEAPVGPPLHRGGASHLPPGSLSAHLWRTSALVQAAPPKADERFQQSDARPSPTPSKPSDHQRRSQDAPRAPTLIGFSIGLVPPALMTGEALANFPQRSSSELQRESCPGKSNRTWNHRSPRITAGLVSQRTAATRVRAAAAAKSSVSSLCVRKSFITSVVTTMIY